MPKGELAMDIFLNQTSNEKMKYIIYINPEGMSRL